MTRGSSARSMSVIGRRFCARSGGATAIAARDAASTERWNR
jgi:hypothetical protein